MVPTAGTFTPKRVTLPVQSAEPFGFLLVAHLIQPSRKPLNQVGDGLTPGQVVVFRCRLCGLLVRFLHEGSETGNLIPFWRIRVPLYKLAMIEKLQPGDVTGAGIKREANLILNHPGQVGEDGRVSALPSVSNTFRGLPFGGIQVD